MPVSVLLCILLNLIITVNKSMINTKSKASVTLHGFSFLFPDLKERTDLVKKKKKRNRSCEPVTDWAIFLLCFTNTVIVPTTLDFLHPKIKPETFGKASTVLKLIFYRIVC